MQFLAWIVLGAVAGVLGKLIMPGKDGGGIFLTIILGIIGAFVGGFVSGFIPIDFFKPVEGKPLALGSIVSATVGAIVVLFLWRLITKKKR